MHDMQKLRPATFKHLCFSLEEECALSSCSATLEERNMEVHASLKKLANSITKIDTYISIIAAQGKLRILWGGVLENSLRIST